METLRSILGWTWRTMVQAFFATLALVTIVGVWGYTSAMAILQYTPELDLTRLKLKQSVRILDRRGGDLYRFYDEEDRFYLPGEEIPQIVKDAFVAIEDERFFTRNTCIDIRAILRAANVNLFGDDGRTEGASTITQQLVRNLYLTREKTIDRKLKEIDLACQLEQAVPKDEILTIYLNQLPFGNNAFGIEQAAQTYFGTSAADVSLAQAAVLASIPQRNSYFNPYGTHDRTAVDHDAVRKLRTGEMDPATLSADQVKIGLLSRVQRTPAGLIRIPGRAELVLDAMKRNGFISETEHAEALREIPRVSFKPAKHPIAAPHFTLRVRQEIDSLLGGLDRSERWLTEGMEVHTTLDPVLQWIAEDVTEQALPRLNGAGIRNVALVAIDRKTRQVLAYVGNADYFGESDTGQIDMAATPRQPGSSFKPIVYSALFEDGYGPDSFIEDSPIHIGNNVPKNYDGNFRGWMSVKKALGGSRNIPAINAFLAVGGEERVLDLAARMGAPAPLQYKLQQELKGRDFVYGWPLAIGSAEVPLVEMVQAYATISEHGQFRPLQSICKLTTRNGDHERILPSGPTTQAVLPQAADGVDEVLRDDDSKPSGYWRDILNIPGMDLGAKTGTSNLCFERDQAGRCREYAVSNIWTIGYNEEMVVGVWAGNADGAPLGELVDGLTEAAPIWREFLIRASKFYQSQDHC